MASFAVSEMFIRVIGPKVPETAKLEGDQNKAEVSNLQEKTGTR